METLNFVAKYKKLARRATHSNDWIRKIATADLTKSLYENDITSGTCIDGKCISLAAIEKRCGRTVMGIFRDAVKRKKSYISPRFDFCGYDGTLWCEAYPNGDVKAGFSKEYRNCGNGLLSVNQRHLRDWVRYRLIFTSVFKLKSNENSNDNTTTRQVRA